MTRLETVSRTTPLTPRAAKVLALIADSIERTGIAPSYQEMMEALGLHSKTSIGYAIDELESEGHILRLPRRARAIKLVNAQRPKLFSFAAALRAPVPEGVLRATTGNLKTPKLDPAQIMGRRG